MGVVRDGEASVIGQAPVILEGKVVASIEMRWSSKDHEFANALRYAELNESIFAADGQRSK